jgi:hypothetical protein
LKKSKTSPPKLGDGEIYMSPPMAHIYW